MNNSNNLSPTLCRRNFHCEIGPQTFPSELTFGVLLFKFAYKLAHGFINALKIVFSLKTLS